MAVEERIVLLGAVAVAIARCDGEGLDLALDACHRHDTASRDLPAAILQGIPYSGFPGAIDALGRWASRRDEPPTLRSDPPPSSGDGPAVVGDRIFREVYGSQADRVLQELRGHAPSLERWIVDFAYGTVMAGGLPLVDIEALGVASLVAQGRRRPLHSHLRGALRTGWSPDDLREYVARVSVGCRPGISEYAAAVIAGFE